MKKLLILLMLLSFNVFAKPIDINSADAKTISESLKGIGAKKAEEIVRYRKENGPFKSLNDLTNVKGVGDKTVEKNAENIKFSKVKKDKKAKKQKKSK